MHIDIDTICYHNLVHIKVHQKFLPKSAAGHVDCVLHRCCGLSLHIAVLDDGCTQVSSKTASNISSMGKLLDTCHKKKVKPSVEMKPVSNRKQRYQLSQVVAKWFENQDQRPEFVLVGVVSPNLSIVQWIVEKELKPNEPNISTNI